MDKVKLTGGPWDGIVVECIVAGEMRFPTVVGEPFTWPYYGYADYELDDSGKTATFVREGIFDIPYNVDLVKGVRHV